MSAPSSRSRRAPLVFADRDGTLIEEVGFLSRADQIRLIPGVAAAIRSLNAAGVPFIVASNQSGVARGLIDPAFAARGGELLAALLAREGARIDGYRYCPHHVEGKPPYNFACACRKPAPGMLEAEARERGVSLAGAIMIGDRRSDVETGAALGVLPVLVRTGAGRDHEHDLPPDFHARGGCVADDFAAAVKWILGREQVG